MLARLAIAWLMICSFLLGMAVVRMSDSARVADVVTRMNDNAARLRERLMEIERGSHPRS